MNGLETDEVDCTPFYAEEYVYSDHSCGGYSRGSSWAKVVVRILHTEIVY